MNENQQADYLYLECHVTFEPVFGDDLARLSGIAERKAAGERGLGDERYRHECRQQDAVGARGGAGRAQVSATLCGGTERSGSCCRVVACH